VSIDHYAGVLLYGMAAFIYRCHKGMDMNRHGQSCSLTSRVFVRSSLHDSVVAELLALAGFEARGADPLANEHLKSGDNNFDDDEQNDH
jgi:hypothetical protein